MGRAACAGGGSASEETPGSAAVGEAGESAGLASGSGGRALPALRARRELLEADEGADRERAYLAAH
jgi:hypothetical protein